MHQFYNKVMCRHQNYVNNNETVLYDNIAKLVHEGVHSCLEEEEGLKRSVGDAWVSDFSTDGQTKHDLQPFDSKVSGARHRGSTSTDPDSPITTDFPTPRSKSLTKPILVKMLKPISTSVKAQDKHKSVE